MTSPPRALLPPDGDRLDLEALTLALATRFEVVVGARRTVLQTRVDTFDRRLRSAGLTLEHRVDSRRRASGALVLVRAGEPGLRVSCPEPRWPTLAEGLPEGRLRHLVAPVSGIRALLVVAGGRRVRRVLDLRNQDAKTVARIELDEPVDAATAAGASVQAGPVVTIRELRGYAEEARRAAGLLAAAGLRPVPDGEDDAGPEPGGSAAAGATSTGAALADRLGSLGRGAAATELLAASMAGFLAAMDENLPGLLDDVDTEFLHDFRVAVRRTRATLKLGRPALPVELGERWEPAFKWLGDLTTPMRDLDVYQLDLPEMAGWLVAADPGDLAPFAAHLRRRRTTARRSLVRGLRSARYTALVTDWRGTLGRLAAPPGGTGTDANSLTAADSLTAGELADRGITKAYRRVARDGAAITAASPAADLHDLRKRCKELRYALEVFAPVVDAAARKRAIVDLKGLQDVLGRFQDTEVQRHALRDFAGEMVAAGTSAAAVLAMGELIGHLDAEQDRARAQFDGAFARFARPASAARLRGLGGAG